MKPIFAWVVLRFLLGFTLLWAFFDKLFGLGYATKPGAAWLAGGSPTTGYLTHATHGPFTGIFQTMAGNPIVDWLFMLGLLLIGSALILGIGLRIAAWTGALLFALMLISAYPPANNPLFDEHLVYIVILMGIAYSESGSVLGLAKPWSRTKLVKSNPWLL